MTEQVAQHYGKGGGKGGLLGIHGILLHLKAVALVIILWEVFTIFVSCVVHFIHMALFVFSHVWIVLEVEEGNEFS